MTIAGIGTLAVIVLFALHGMKKGLVKKVSGLLSIIIAAFLVRFLLPYVTDALRSTAVYDYVVSLCENAVGDTVIRTAQERVLSAAADSGQTGPDREAIRALLDQNGYDSSVVDTLSDSELEAYVRNYFQSYAGTVTQEASAALDTLTKVEQTDLIHQLPVPAFLQRLMINYNNSEGYKKLGAADFSQYLVNFAAGVIINILSFLVTMLVVWLIVRGIIAALDLCARLPVVGFFNRAGGLIAGAIEGLFFVWFVFLIISLLSGTPVGAQIQNMIADSLVLQPVFDANVFLKIVSDAMQRII